MIIKVPTSITSNSNDYVSFRTVYYNDPMKDTGKTVQDHIGRACYSSVMSRLSSCELTCFPNQCDSVLPADIYFRWVTLCQANGLIPTDATYDRVENKNLLIIPKNNHSRHRIYAALCCYRWAETIAPMVYLIVKGLEHNPGINFYQFLHYGLGKHIKNTNHSFCAIANVTGSAYSEYGRSGQWWLPWSIGLRLFFTKSFADTVNSYNTNYAINKFINDMGLREPDKPRAGLAKCCVWTAADILWPEWTPLYEMDEPTAKTIHAEWEKIAKGKGLLE